MISFRVKNLRSIKDSGAIPLAPVTLVVGGNSSGKSTLLRALPLLKQSCETSTSSPVLWYGRYVDFGSYDEALCRASNEGLISFEFGFAMKSAAKSSRYVYPATYLNPLSSLSCAASLALSRTTEENRTGIESCALAVGDHKITLKFDGRKVSGVCVNNEEFGAEGLYTVGPASFLPYLSDFDFEDSISVSKSDLIYLPVDSSALKRRGYPYPPALPLKPEILHQRLRAIAHKNSGHDRIQALSSGIRIGTHSEMFECLVNLADVRGWKQAVTTRGMKNPSIIGIINAYIFSVIPALLRYVDRQIAEMAASVRYVGPFRAMAQRYYRIQDLAVNEIDFRGENLAMYLRSLTRQERLELASFTKKYFGITVNSVSESGHAMVTLAEGPESRPVNLADSGFGYSQVLPVIMQAWSASRFSGPEEAGERYLVIEQPELHLHPALQAKIADIVIGAVRAAKEVGGSLCCLLETHSEAMINRFGCLIAEGAIQREDVSVLLVEKPNYDAAATVRAASFDSDGGLIDWPYGFFSPS